MIIPKGYTSKYLAGEVTMDEQVDKIMGAYRMQDAASDFVLFEGTGAPRPDAPR